MNSLVERVFRALTSWKRAAPVDEHEHIYSNEQHIQSSGGSGAGGEHLHPAVSIANSQGGGSGGVIWSTNHHNHNHQNHHQNSSSHHRSHSQSHESDELIDLTQYPNSNSNHTSTDSSHYYYTMGPNNNNNNNSDQHQQQQQTTMTTINNSEQQQNQTLTLTGSTNQQQATQTTTTSSSSGANILRFSFINPASSTADRRSTRHSNHRNRNNNNNNTNTTSRRSGGNESTSSSSASSSMSDETSDLFSSSTAANTTSSIGGMGKRRERNLLAACCSIFCIAVLCVSLVETRWFYLNGGGCNVNYIGVAHFFAPSPLDYQLEYSKVTKSEIIVYTFILPNGLELKNCANREIMVIMRTVIAFVFLAIFSSSLALMLDTCGCMRPGMKLVRRHAIFHILTCIFCLAINGFCFWVSERMNEQQNETRPKRGKRVDVAFDVSYYLIVLASGLSILATAFTLIRRYPTDEDEQLERLLEEYTGFEEPLLHLERSLPAVSVNQPNQPQIHSCQVIRPHSRRTHSQSSDHLQPPPPPPPLPPPPPPLHPPPSLLNSSRVYQPVVMSTTTTGTTGTSSSEPPPPYDPTPTFA